MDTKNYYEKELHIQLSGHREGKIKHLEHRVEILQERIDKAIKVIEDDLKFGFIGNKYIRYDYSTGDLLEILHILQGENIRID